MRMAAAIPIAVMFALPAAAQQPTPVKPAPKPAAAKPVPAAAAIKSYASMPEAERIAIQNDLIWTGDFVGTATSEFGERSVAAVKAFQKRQGHKETGVLNPAERALLAGAAKRRQDAVGWRIVNDAATGVRLGVPGKLVPQASAQGGGARWQSARGEVRVETFRINAPGTTLAAVHEAQRKLEGRKLNYNILRSDFFVLSGLQGLKKFYTRAQMRGDEVRGFTLLYDQATEGTLDPVAIAMSSAFNPFPTDAAAVPPPRRKVEYATAVIVDAGGILATTRDATDACQTITVTGLGPAELIAADKDSSLALLRVYGARNLKSFALAEAVAAGDATLIGVPDPQAQPSSASPIAAATRIGMVDARPLLASAPPAGFAGAAVIDRAGSLLGVADMRPQVLASAGASNSPPQPNVIATDAIRKLAQANGVALSGSSPGEDFKASVRRVICVRK
jgi:peptidoglycan hydrolase-like protein with peptidoglycan-binding domain